MYTLNSIFGFTCGVQLVAYEAHFFGFSHMCALDLNGHCDDVFEAHGTLTIAFFVYQAYRIPRSAQAARSAQAVQLRLRSCKPSVTTM